VFPVRYELNVYILFRRNSVFIVLREERRPRVFKNVILRRIFGPKKDEVIGAWRKLHNEEPRDLHPSPNLE
jgi:hypothetical protein